MKSLNQNSVVKGAWKTALALGCGALVSTAFASTVNVDVTEEHQVIRGFGGMVHNSGRAVADFPRPMPSSRSVRAMARLA